MEPTEKKTPLYENHRAHGGKLVPFAGHLLPVQYAAGVIAEHNAVRTAAGLFDVSHMGEVFIEGEGALAALSHLLTNEFADMADGQVRYSPMLNERGGIVDDLLIYRLSAERYMLVVNAANRAKDVAWLRAHLPAKAALSDRSDEFAQLALQGPAARAILKALAPTLSLPAKYYSFVDGAQILGARCLISRTGYTGEAGYELYLPAHDAPRLFEALLATGHALGLLPCGLGARDTLRLEAGMPLYGHEMDEDISPLEARLDAFVRMEKPDFIGKQALLARGAPKVVRVGLEVTGRGIAREREEVYAGERRVGRTTSGTYCPFLKRALAMALVDAEQARPGTQLAVDIRGKRTPVRVVPLPFYARPRKVSDKK